MKLLKISGRAVETTYSEAVYELANGARRTVFFAADASLSATDTAAHFFILGVLAAYLRSEPYEQSEAVDSRLYQNMRELMHRWQDWRGKKPVKIRVPAFRDGPENSEAKGCGCLFTGGIDSLFTVHQHISDIAMLVNVVHRATARGSWDRIQPNTSLQAFAETQGKPLITIETNMMFAFPEIMDAWASMAHGTAYSAVGYFLGQSIDRLLISSSFTYDQLRPWGSHPETDRLLSSSSLSVDHIGAETNRFEKLRVLSRNPDFMRHLSICEHGPQSGERLNCSQCQKCLRTMIGLDLLGLSPEQAPTFDWSDYRPEKLTAFLLAGHVNCSEMLQEARRLKRVDIERVLTDTITYSKKHHWIVTVEFFLRRRLALMGRHRAFFIRVRHFMYRLLNIKTRRHDGWRDIQ